jgi:hypothetical protein
VNRLSNLPQQIVHIFLLCGLAVAQPLYSLIAQNAEFLVVHQVDGGALLLIVTLLSFALPMVLIVPLLITMSYPRIRAYLTAVYVFLLVAIIVLPIANPLFEHWLTTLLVSLTTGLAFAWAYSVFPFTKMWLSAFSPAVILFPLIFLLFTPVKYLLLLDAGTLSAQILGTSRPPIVLVVFDEFGTEALLDENRGIDSVRFPHFAELADNATWYKNATTIQLATSQVVPAILSGRYPYFDETSHLPIVKEHPQNLFTWLGSTYPLNVSERITSLCPASLCGDAERSVSWAALANDSFYIYLHMIVPDAAPIALPDISAGWSNFQDTEVDAEESARPYLREGERFERFIAQISQENASGLHVIHSVLPHVPYIYLPSGLIYSTENGVPMGVTDEKWADEPELVALGYQRYLFQIGYTDTLLGKLLDRLKALGVYEEALIIVTADHGVSFEQGLPRRDLTRTSYPNVLPVPLLVKLPLQQDPLIDDRFVSNLDIVPTIAAVLNVNLPWQADGKSLLAGHSLTEINIPFPAPSGDRTFDPKTTLAFASLDQRIERFGSGTDLQHYLPKRDHSVLVGQPAPAGAVAPQLKFKLRDAPARRNVNSESGFIPALISGEIIAPAPTSRPYDLAIAVNGTFQAIAKSFEFDDSPHFFSAIMHEGAFQPNANEISIYLISKSESGDAELTRIANLGASWSNIHSRKNLFGSYKLVGAEGDDIELSPHLKGYLEVITIANEQATFAGWAIDENNTVPADQVHLVLDDMIVISAPTGATRKDIAERYQDNSLLLSGYRLNLPLGVLEAALAQGFDIGNLKLIATSRDGNINELKINAKAINKARLALGETNQVSHDSNGNPRARLE